MADDNFDKGISDAQRIISQLEEREKLRQLSQERRSKSIANLNASAAKISEEWAELSNLAIKASNEENLTQKDALKILKKAHQTQSYWLQKPALEEAIDAWFNKLVDARVEAVIDLVISEHPKVIDEAYFDDVFKNQNAPDFWPRVGEVFNKEVAQRSIAIDRIYDKVLLLRLTGVGDMFASQPTTEQIRDLEAQIREMERQKAEFKKRIVKRNQYFNRWQEELMEKNNERITKGEITAEEIDEEAAKLADQQLADEEKPPEEVAPDRKPQEQPIRDSDETKTLIPPAPGHRFVPSSTQGTNWRTSLLNAIHHPFEIFRVPKRAKVASQTASQDTTGTRISLGRKEDKQNIYRVGKAAQNMGTTPGIGWRANLKIFLSNPFKAIAGFFKGAKTVGTAAKVGATVAGGAAVEGGAVAAGTAAGGVPGLVIAAVLLVKKIINNEHVQNILSKLKIAAAAAILWLLLNPGAAIGGIIGAMLGGSVGSLLLPVLGPLAPMAGSVLGFSVGAFVGYSFQGIVSSILGIGGGGVPTVSASAVAPVASISIGGFTIPAGLSSAASSFGAMLSGSGISSIVLFGVGGGIGALILSVTITLAAVLQTPEDQKPLGQSIESVFTLKKVALTPEIIDYNEGPATLSYKLTIQQGTNPITIESITDKLTRSNSSSWSQDVSVPVSQDTYDVPISGPEFKDTYVYNLVTVKAKDNVTGKEETNTASAKVKVGSPLAEKNQPYGYPASGTITTLDAQIFDSDGHVHSSCFMNFSPCKWVKGGIDIAPRGGDPTVYSTIDGEVIKAQFIRSSSSIGDVGGVIYIQKGPYIVEYMHLDESVNGLSGHVSRGQPIGKIYLGTLGATSGPHVHYQVLFNNANLYFNDPNIVGKCSDDKILPVQPVQHSIVGANTSTVCE